MTNYEIAELLARNAESAKQPLQKAMRRAARRDFLWPDEAECLLQEGRSLTELTGVGPYMSRQIADWLGHPPTIEQAPSIRAGFLTLVSRGKIAT